MEAVVGSTRAGLRFGFDPLLVRLFDLLLYAYVFVTIFLPSGSIYGVNLKYPLYLGILPLAVYNFFRQRQATVTRLAAVIVAPTLLSLWIVIGLCRGFALAGALRQYTDIALTLLMCWLVLLFCGEEESRRLQFLSLVLTAEIATSLLKIGLIAYALVRGIPVFQVMTTLSKVFNVDLMTMDIGSLFGRIQFVSDALIPTCIFIVLRHRDRLRIGSLRASLTILLLLASVVFSFSRYFWGFTVFALVLGLLLGKRDRFQAILLGLIGAVAIISLPALVSLYDLRFSQAVAGGSDLARVEQGQALKNFFFASPFLGHGLGSYTTQIVRVSDSAVQRYGYEKQLLALAGQVGLLGMAFLLLLIAWYYKRLWGKSTLSVPDRIGLGSLLLFWLAAGLYNPLLLNSVSGITYASLAALAAIKSKKLETSPGP